MDFTFGGVFSRFFKLIGENLSSLLVVGLLFTIAPAVASYYGLFIWASTNGTDWQTTFMTMRPEVYALLGGGGLVFIILNLIGTCAITEIAILGGGGSKVNLASVLSHAVRNAFPVLILGFIVGLLTALLSLLLIIPGIMFLLAAYVAIPAYVGQPGLGLWGAVKRSFELTRNHRWGILGLLIVMGIISGIISAALSGIASVTPMADVPLSLSITQGLINGASTLIDQIFVAAIYVSLRKSKDRTMPEQAAAVFE
ncbi:hypothetical protein MMA231_03171 [Asticcacaulis sp. MM231]|uniref:hypothetical protein n=1 Tax=Asticcacaulis sp. MM231 TaxID=3157666 RepID=UPI0032D5A4E3